MIGTSISHLTRKWLLILAFFVLAFASLSQVRPASAQLSLQIGGSEAEYHAQLRQAGYNQIATVKIGMSSSIFEACKGSQRFRIRFDWIGGVEERVIGSCRPVLNEAGIIRLLEGRGYQRVTVERGERGFVAYGCLRSDRYQIGLNELGDIESERRVGRCQRELAPSDITAQLEREGYDRIEFISRTLDGYVVQACLNRDKQEMDINRFGQVLTRKNIGRCSGAVSIGEITQILERRGYTRIVVLDDRLPVYRLQACRGDEQLELQVSRFGDIRGETVTGQCRRPFTVAQVIEAMENNGYTQITVREERGIFIARGCQSRRMQEVRLSRFGELIDRKDVGPCQAPRIDEIAESLERRGMRDLTFFVEGCEGNRRVRIEMDRFGNRLDRRVIGGC